MILKANWMLTIALIVFMAQGAHANDYCPNPNLTPPEKGGFPKAALPSGIAITDVGDLVWNRSGNRVGYMPFDKCHGLTAWYDPQSGYGFTSGHGFVGLVNKNNKKPYRQHIIAPDIGPPPRSCNMLRPVPAPPCKCRCGIFCCATCSVLVTDYAELGQVNHEIVPVNQISPPKYNQDDLMVFPTKSMTASIRNIGVPGSDLGTSQLAVGQQVQFNGGISCHQTGTFTQIMTNTCDTETCYAQEEEFDQIQGAMGDSGSPIVTDDANLHLVGQLTEVDSANHMVFAIPIGQIRQDAVEMFGIGEVVPPTEAVAQASPTSTTQRSASQIWPTVSQAQAEAEYPELWKAQHRAEAAIAANQWVLRVPHVKGLNPKFILDKNASNKGVGETGIRVWVDQQEDVREVEGQVPSQLDGVRVVVEPNPRRRGY